MSTPRPSAPRVLTAGAVLVLAGFACWLLYLHQSAGVEHHSYNRSGDPQAYVRLEAGQAYTIAIRGGVDREIELGRDPAALRCTAARPGEAPGALSIAPESKDSKATNVVATFISGLSGRVHVECAGVGPAYVDNAEGASYDWSGVWLVLASVALAVGFPLGLSGLRSTFAREPAGFEAR